MSLKLQTCAILSETYNENCNCLSTLHRKKSSFITNSEAATQNILTLLQSKSIKLQTCAILRKLLNSNCSKEIHANSKRCLKLATLGIIAQVIKFQSEKRNQCLKLETFAALAESGAAFRCKFQLQEKHFG